MPESITTQEQTFMARLIRLEVYMEEARKNAIDAQVLLNRIESKLEQQSIQNMQIFITRQEFSPIKALVYGFAGIILTLVITALVYMVIHRPT